MYTKIAVALADTKPTENALGSNLLSLRDWRRSFQTRRETQPMIASDATAQRAAPCPSGSPSAPACWVRCSLMPRTRPHGIADFVNTELHGVVAGGLNVGASSRSFEILVLRGAYGARLRQYLPFPTLLLALRSASLSWHHPACAHRQQSAGRHHPRRHRLLARYEPRLQFAVGRQRFAWPGRTLRLRRRALLPPAA